MRKTVVHRSHIGKGAASVAHGEACALVATEEEQSRVLFPWVAGFLFIGIDVVENSLAALCLTVQVVHYRHDLVGVYIGSTN